MKYKVGGTIEQNKSPFEVRHIGYTQIVKKPIIYIDSSISKKERKRFIKSLFTTKYE